MCAAYYTFIKLGKVFNGKQFSAVVFGISPTRLNRRAKSPNAATNTIATYNIITLTNLRDFMLK